MNLWKPTPHSRCVQSYFRAFIKMRIFKKRLARLKVLTLYPEPLTLTLNPKPLTLNHAP